MTLSPYRPGPECRPKRTDLYGHDLISSEPAGTASHPRDGLTPPGSPTARLAHRPVRSARYLPTSARAAWAAWARKPMSLPRVIHWKPSAMRFLLMSIVVEA